MPPELRIVFAGTPLFSVPALRALAEAGHRIVAVYTQPDRPAGRGRKLAASPVKQAAQQLNIAIEQPQSLRGEERAGRLAQYAADVMVVAAYGLILPPEILRIPRIGCINIHASLLPRWRGAAPIQRAILAGDSSSGISIMQMEEGLDTGPVYMRKEISLESRETGGSLHDRLSLLGATAIIQALAQISAGRVSARPQDEAAATYARKIDKSEAWIDWSVEAAQIERRVRAFNPSPVAQMRWRDAQLRIWSAHVAQWPAPPASPGTLLAAGDEILVACARDALSLEMVQLPGGRPISAAAFLRGAGAALPGRAGLDRRLGGGRFPGGG